MGGSVGVPVATPKFPTPAKLPSGVRGNGNGTGARATPAGTRARPAPAIRGNRARRLQAARTARAGRASFVFRCRVTETQVIFRGSGIGGGVGCKLVDAPELGKGRKELDARRPCARPPVQPCADGRPGESNTRLVKEDRSPSATCPRSTGARWRSGIGDRLHTRRVAVRHASVFPPAIDVSAAFKMERPSWSSCRRGLL